jgi:hypothetical protein
MQVLEKQNSKEDTKDKQRTDKGMIAELQERVKKAESDAMTMRSDAAVLKEMVHTLKARKIALVCSRFHPPFLCY